MSRVHVYLRAGEALLALLAAHALLRLLSIEAITRALGFEIDRPDPQALPHAMTPLAANVRRALGSAAGRLPWTSSCLVRALAGSMMLRRRGIGSVLVFGVRRDEAELAAHAWLAVADGTVCGGEEAANFRPLAAFRRRAA